tara:strand:- start:469 stop:1014 length:546 start_codon:yes stop_codon:yes gene_type:complete
MDVESNVLLIEKMFSNEIIFQPHKQKQNLTNYESMICKDYGGMNLLLCKKIIKDDLDKKKYIKQLSKISIRTTLFDSYFEINKIEEKDKNYWIEKIIYNKENYNIQEFKKTDLSLLCFSNLELDDDSYDYSWINNPFTLITFDGNYLILKIAFEVSNTYQDEILNNFLSCLDKLELALTNN